MAKTVKVYSTPTCPFCVRVKQFLKDNNIAFEDINVSADQAKADEIGLIQLKTGESEEAIIRAQRLVSEEKFVQAKAVFLRVPYVDLDTIGFSPEALALVPESVSRKYKIVPYKLDTKNKLLYVAMANPLDLETVEFIEKKSGVRVSSSMALEKQIMNLI